MNNPNPFIPQGSLLEQKNKKRARVKVAVFSIFAVNILVISPLLIQGCKKEATPDSSISSNTTPAETNVDANPAPPLPPMTNTPAPPPVVSNTPPPPPPPPVEVPTTKEYVVAKGDSFYSIAKKFGLKIKEVQAANPTVVPTKLKVGQKLQIPPGGGGGSAGNPMAAPDAGGDSSIYVVKSGDSLTKIAKEHGISVKTLRAANELKTDKIKVGQKLKVPAKAATVEAPVSPPMNTAPSAPPPAPLNSTATPGPGR